MLFSLLAVMQGAGIDLRPMQSIYMFPTLVIFAEGKGIAGARALIEAGSDAHGLDLYFRQDVRLYYRVSLLQALEKPSWYTSQQKFTVSKNMHSGFANGKTGCGRMSILRVPCTWECPQSHLIVPDNVRPWAMPSKDRV